MAKGAEALLKARRSAASRVLRSETATELGAIVAVRRHGIA
jgi:hypothetical protein